MRYLRYQGSPNLNRYSSTHTLKPENILLATPGSYPRVLIADFGLARDQAWQATAHIVGTTSYLPPEAIQALARKDAMYVGPPADCWSLGVVIYVMLRWARFVCYSTVLLISSS